MIDKAGAALDEVPKISKQLQGAIAETVRACAVSGACNPCDPSNGAACAFPQ